MPCTTRRSYFSLLGRNREYTTSLPTSILLSYRESRRANGNLRANKVDDLLATLLMPNGSVSPRFPKDLKGLFSLDGESIDHVF